MNLMPVELRSSLSEPGRSGQQIRAEYSCQTMRTQTVVEIEARRRVEQERLDRLKTLEERNRLGQFATPPALALDIARYAAALWQGRSDQVAFLDPAIGSGSFYSALRQVFPTDSSAMPAASRSTRPSPGPRSISGKGPG